MDNNIQQYHFYPAVPKTKTLRAEKLLDVPASLVWKIVGDFSGFDKFTDGLNKCQMIGEGVGQVRVKAFESGDYVVDQISFRDEKTMKMHFNIISTSLNIRNLWEFMHVEELPNSRSKIIWQMAGEPKTGSQEQLEQFLSNFAHDALENVKNIFSMPETPID